MALSALDFGWLEKPVLHAFGNDISILGLIGFAALLTLGLVAARFFQSDFVHRVLSRVKIEEKVKDIIVEQLGVNPEQVTPQASFIEDLGADSLDIVELVMAFEEEFSVEVPDEDAEKLQTVGDVINYIKERAKQPGGESGGGGAGGAS